MHVEFQPEKYTTTHWDYISQVMSNSDWVYRSAGIVHTPRDSGVALICCDVPDANALPHKPPPPGDVTGRIVRRH